MEIETTQAMVSSVYERLEKNSAAYRRVVGRPLTLSEKILSGHLAEMPEESLDQEAGYVFLMPDRVALRMSRGRW